MPRLHVPTAAEAAANAASLDRVWQRLAASLDQEPKERPMSEDLKRRVTFPDGLTLEGPGAGALLSPFTRVVSPGRPAAALPAAPAGIAAKPR